MPLPEPLAPAVNVIQPTVLVAVHEQPVATTTDKELVLAVDGAEALVGDRAALQPDPACLTVKMMPAIVVVPVRGLVLGFPATV